MKKLSAILILPGLYIVSDSCHLARKSLKKVDYDDSIFRATDKLKNNPTHISSLEILRQAFPNAVKQHLENINSFETLPDIQRWGELLSSYQILNKLYKAVKPCHVCMPAVSAKARNYYHQTLSSFL